MKKALYLFVLVLICTSISCSDDAKPKPRCSADCDGLLIANPDHLCVLEDSVNFDGGTVSCDYNETTKACEIVTTDCIGIEGPQTTEAGPKESCSGAGLVCPEGYDCIRTNGGQVQLCLQDCSTDSTICVAGDYCDTENYVFDAAGVCWNPGDINQPCLSGGTTSEGACSGEGVECLPNGNGYGNSCLLQCSGATVDQEGIAAGCAADEWCLADQSGFISGLEFEMDENDNYVECAGLDHSLCNADEKYRCQKVNSSSYPDEVCARDAGRCGKKMPVQMDLSEAALDIDGGLEPENFCNRRGQNQFCEGYSETAGVTAHVQCVQLGWGYNLKDDNDQSFPCSEEIDCGMRGAECISWSEESTCGYLGAICVAYCESGDGSETYTCPNNLSCAAPDSMIGYILEKDADGESIDCTSENECGEGFLCHEFSDGGACIRYRKVCTDAVVDPCVGVDCGAHGTCQAAGDSTTCSCDAGYTSAACDACDTANNYIASLVDSTTCVADPCLNETCSGNGTCSQQADDTSACTCTDVALHSAATNCQCSPTQSLVDIASTPTCFDDPCLLATPCFDHGTCVSSPEMVSGSLSLVKACTCETEYDTASHCENCATGYHDVGGTCVAD